MNDSTSDPEHGRAVVAETAGSAANDGREEACASERGLLDLLVVWEEQYRKGLDPTPEAICAGHPEVIAEFRARMMKQRAVLDFLQIRPAARDKDAKSELEVPDFPGYETLGLVDCGGMGNVYKARHLELGRVVAIKTIATGRFATAEQVERFRSEAQAIARLQHPNILAIHAIEQRGNQPYLALEFAAGGNLARRLGEKPMGPREAAEMLETLARAVEAAHRAGVVHRDLKPSNILLTADGVPKVGDFGLAKLLDADSGRTVSGEPVGTPSYMAPEQAAGEAKRVGPAADVYALGAILYEALTGKPPFLGESALETIKMVTTADVVGPRGLRSDIPRDLETICLKCLEKRPGDRYATAVELAEDLRRFMSDEPIRARRVGVPARLTKWAKRHPSQTALVGTLLFTASALFALTYQHNLQLRAEISRTRSMAEKADVNQRRARSNYQEARTTIQEMLARLYDPRVAGSPRLLDMRSDLRQGAMEFYEKVLSHADSEDVEVRVDNARALNELAAIQYLIGRSSDAVKSLRKSLDITEALTVQPPVDQEILRVKADALAKLGPPHYALGEFDKALDGGLKALELLKPIANQEPDDAKSQENLATCHVGCGNALTRLGRKYEARVHYQAANEIRERIDPAKLPGVTRRLAQGLINEGVMYWGEKEIPKAEKDFIRAEELLLKVPKDEVGAGDDVDSSIGLLDLNWSGMLHLAGRPLEAIERADAGLQHIERRLTAEPSDANAREYCLQLHGNRAYALMAIKEYPEALKEWRRIIELSGQPVPVRYRCLLALCLFTAGETVDALAQLDVCGPDPSILSVESYNIACIYGLAANDLRTANSSAKLAGVADGERDRRVDAQVSKALLWLRDAANKGLFKDPHQQVHAKQDDDLKILRGRPEFRQIIDQAGEKK